MKWRWSGRVRRRKASFIDDLFEEEDEEKEDDECIPGLEWIEEYLPPEEIVRVMRTSSKSYTRRFPVRRRVPGKYSRINQYLKQLRAAGLDIGTPNSEFNVMIIPSNNRRYCTIKIYKTKKV